MANYGPHLTHESRIVVMGLPRYGKTRFIRDVLTADSERVLYHDITGHDYYAKGRIALSIDELEERPLLLEQRHVRIVVICKTPGDPDYIKEEITRLCDVLYSTQDIVAVFDEVGSHHRKTEKILNGLFARGNHTGIVPVQASQKATDIGLGARTTCSDAYCFGQHHPKELQALYDCFGDVYAAKASASRKGDNPIHWSIDTREQFWSAKARNKFGNQAEAQEQ